jgi:2-iminoacetate synthase ThiH
MGALVVWRITEACNLGCHFCAYSRHVRLPRGCA